VFGGVDLEILIVSYNSADTLGTCLASIQSAAPGTPIAIREHGNDEAAFARLEMMRAAHPAPVRLEHDPTNPGFAAGCNALASVSAAEWLLFLNPDAEIVAWPWTGADAPPRQAIVGPRMVDSGHPGHHSGVRYRVRDEITRSWLRRRGPRPHGRGFVSGAALLIDRESFARIGGFDDHYFLFYEDIDLCLRANQAGIRTCIDERWTVRHSGAHSTQRSFGRSLMWSYESAIRFHGQNGGGLLGYRIYVVVDSLLRAAVQTGKRNREASTGYRALAKRATRDLLHR
jgi:GT2 family glycosyltransferase